MLNKELLKAFAENDLLVQAVRDLLISRFDLPEVYSDVRGVNNFTNEEIGQYIRSRIEALMAIEEAFKEIEQYKTITSKPTESNPGR